MKINSVQYSIFQFHFDRFVRGGVVPVIKVIGYHHCVSILIESGTRFKFPNDVIFDITFAYLNTSKFFGESQSGEIY